MFVGVWSHWTWRARELAHWRRMGSYKWQRPCTGLCGPLMCHLGLRLARHVGQLPAMSAMRGMVCHWTVWGGSQRGLYGWRRRGGHTSATAAYTARCKADGERPDVVVALAWPDILLAIWPVEHVAIIAFEDTLDDATFVQIVESRRMAWTCVSALVGGVAINETPAYGAL
jgi:hypothetical protein